jgi:hypothetical protein
MQFLCSYELKIKSFRLITLTKKLKITKQNKRFRFIEKVIAKLM